jgi:hypothetical protein
MTKPSYQSKIIGSTLIAALISAMAGVMVGFCFGFMTAKGMEKKRKPKVEIVSVGYTVIDYDSVEWCECKRIKHDWHSKPLEVVAIN